MTEVKPGGARRSVEFIQSLTRRLVSGDVATDGVQYSSVATFGTTAVEVFNKTIDPGFNMHLDEIQVHLEERFDNLKTDSVGSLMYHWSVRSNYFDPLGSHGVGKDITTTWMPITGTISKGLGTSGVAADDPVIGTFSGHVDPGSLPIAPFQIKLTALGIVASSMTGEVVSDSWVKFTGRVIPGT